MTVKELLKYEIAVTSSFNHIFTKYKDYCFWLYYNKSLFYIKRDGKYSFIINNSSGTTIDIKRFLEKNL